MGRFEDFAYFKDNQIEDINVLLQHQGVTVDIYRPSVGVSPGFSSELGALEKVARILAYITSDAEPSQVSGGDMRANKQNYIAMTNYLGTQIKDVWRTPDSTEYTVMAVQRELDNIVQVSLERIL